MQTLNSLNIEMFLIACNSNCNVLTISWYNHDEIMKVPKKTPKRMLHFNDFETISTMITLWMGMMNFIIVSISCLHEESTNIEVKNINIKLPY